MNTYTAVETENTVCLKDVHECAEHALGAICGTGLEADLLGVSSSLWTNVQGLGDPLPLLSTKSALSHRPHSQTRSRARTQIQRVRHRGREA